MLTPTGAIALSDWILKREHSFQARTSYLGAHFPSAPGQTRFSMDVFFFWTSEWQPTKMGTSLWLHVARWCLHGFGPADASSRIKPTPLDPKAEHLMPEMLLNEAMSRYNLTFRLFPGGHGHAASKARLKIAAPSPKMHLSGEPHSFWHSHNSTAVLAWTRKYSKPADRAHSR